MFIGPFVRIKSPLGTSAILLLAASALQAQVIVCNTHAGVPPVVRAEGSTELVGDVILQCTGGVAGQVTRSNLTLILNTDITSRYINASQTEALLIIDEFGSPTQGSTAAVYTSLRGTGTNTLVWNDIPITAPGQNQTRTLRMTNVRANATGVPASATLVPSQIFAFLSVTGLALDNPQQPVAFVQPGLTFDVSDCTGTDVISGGAPVGCGGANNSGNRNLLSGTSGNMQYSLRFKEARYTTFQRQISTGQYDQTASVPGVVYLTESGFVRTSTYPYEVGLANHGTRLHARFTNVPVGFRVFVTNTQSLGSTNGSAAVLVQVNGTYVAEPLIPRTPTAMPGTHTLYCPDSQATGFGAVEVPITDGSGEAVWEVTASQSTSVLELLTFGVAVAHSGTPIFGQSSVEGFFGPRYPANQQALPALPMPRFGLSAVPLSAHSMSAVSVAPTVLPANATTTLTIRLADTSCVPSITGIIFDRSDLTPGAMNQVNATTWTVPVTVAPNAAPGAIQATVSTSGPHLVVPLGVGPALYSISGQVTRLSLPLAGVTVTLSGAGSGVRTTDSSGNYSFANLAAGGQYGLQVALANHLFEPPFFSTMGLQANVIANFIATPTASALPFQPLGPSPAAGATISATNPTLSWSPDSAVSSYDVYFGTTPTPPFVANITATTFTPPTLKYGVAYYWRVVAKNNVGSTASSTWYFVNQRAAGDVALGFYPLTPCRIADTRTSQGKTGSFGPPRLSAYVTRSFPITASPCNIPASAQAFSLNFTAIPTGPLDFVSTWPTGQTYPGVSTLNSPGGTVLANAAIVPGGTNGSIEVVAGQSTDLVIDTNGYFGQPGTGHLLFHPSTPCRVADTRTSQGKTGAFGPPLLGAYASRDFPVRSACAIPSAAQAFALNMTVVPVGPLDFLSMWPTGQSYPGVSTLNSPDGSVIANAAIVPAGTNGAVTVVTGNPSEVIMDINGYFAPETFPGGLHFYRLPPCRVMDTRTSQHKTGAFGPPALTAHNSRNIPIRTSTCNVPADAQAYSLNMTVVPAGPMSFLSAWQAGQPFPNVSTLNAPTGRVIANAAIVPAGANGDITVVSGDATELIIDINGYFAP